MKKAFLLAGLLAWTSNAAPAETEMAWGEPVKGITLGLGAPKKQQGLNSAISVTAVVRNDSQEMLRLLNSPVEEVFQMFGSGADRRPVSLKPHEPVGSFGGTYLLQPGTSVAYELFVHDFLVITNTGEFVFTAKRLFADKIGAQEAVSGNVAVKIVPNGSTESNDNEVVGHLTTVPYARSPFGGHIHGNTGAVITAAANAGSIQAGIERTAPRAASSLMARTELPIQVSAVPRPETAALSRTQKLGNGIIITLVALLLAILWRASRRAGDQKP